MLVTSVGQTATTILTICHHEYFHHKVLMTGLHGAIVDSESELVILVSGSLSCMKDRANYM